MASGTARSEMLESVQSHTRVEADFLASARRVEQPGELYGVVRDGAQTARTAVQTGTLALLPASNHEVQGLRLDAESYESELSWWAQIESMAMSVSFIEYHVYLILNVTEIRLRAIQSSCMIIRCLLHSRRCGGNRPVTSFCVLAQ